jgi:hypothetical protein
MGIASASPVVPVCLHHLSIQVDNILTLGKIRSWFHHTMDAATFFQGITRQTEHIPPDDPSRST